MMAQPGRRSSSRNDRNSRTGLRLSALSTERALGWKADDAKRHGQCQRSQTDLEPMDVVGSMAEQGAVVAPENVWALGVLLRQPAFTRGRIRNLTSRTLSGVQSPPEGDNEKNPDEEGGKGRPSV